MALYLEEEDTFFSGDCILGQTRPVFENMSEYVKSLKLIYGLKARKIYPGHGPVIEDPAAKIQEYFRNIERRERLMINTLKATNDPVSTHSLVQLLYLVRNHMEMLVENGVVEKVSADSWRLLARHYNCPGYLATK